MRKFSRSEHADAPVRSKREPVGIAAQLFNDTRPAAAAQLRLQKMADNSLGVQRQDEQGKGMNAPAQLASIVKYRTKSISYDNQSKSEVVGAGATAFLDPDSPINGSAPGSGVQQGLMDYLKKTKDFKSMKRGHLMNGQLGGPGIAENLFPITTRANNYHKLYAENKIKAAIDNDVGVMYDVSVNSEWDVDGTLNGAAEFICSAHVWDPKSNSIDLVEPEPFSKFKVISLPEAGSTGDGEINVIADSKTFLTKDLPKGWGEKGKGLDNWGQKMPGHYSPW